MYITTDDTGFVPKNFVIYTFYGEKTCFCWDENKLVIFPYVSDDIASVRVLTAPGPIKQIQCFSGRIFLICIPKGIYKLSRDREFAVLSKSAVGMGTVFYEVLTPRYNFLCLESKQKKTSKKLFKLPSPEIPSSRLCICPLDVENTEEQFARVVAGDLSTDENLCVIGIGKKLFKLVNETVEIVYSSTYSIRDIIPVRRSTKASGLLLTTDTDIIVIAYCKDERLRFEKICLTPSVRAICASFSQQTRDTLWLVYSDESKLYYAKKQLSMDIVERRRVQDKSFICLQCYDSKVILGLTKNKQLVEFSSSTVEKTLSVENDTFINLHSDMLKGTDVIVDKIYRGSQTLHILNEKLLAEEDKLRRINLYAHAHSIRLCPKLSVLRISDRLFLQVGFDKSLPKNTRMVLSLESKGQAIFCTKQVDESDFTAEMHIPKGAISNSYQISTDLVTLMSEETPWCVIRDYIKDPFLDKNRKKRSKVDKSNFINAKISILKNFIAVGGSDMNKLSEIKKSIRKEFTET